jgi:cobyrinic acid a,c-diamide synthase
MPAQRPAVPALLVAAPGSSSGKTTVTLLLAALARARGLDGRAFKAGPDFIDAQYLGAVSGSPAPSLDPWFLGPAALRAHFARWSAGGDLALVEGVMGLYDGKRGGPFGRHSSAELARHLALPILLVLNARKAGPTLATQALGLKKADPRLRFAGVVLNQTTAKGAALIAPALKKLTGLPLLGWLPTLPALALPERHLGLTAPSEMEAWEQRLHAALPEAEKTLGFDAILRAARRHSRNAATAPGRRPPVVPSALKSFTLAVAFDEAFHFYYPENLALLESHGAELAFFSPLRDRALPPGTQGLLVGGGFPESFGARLAANRPLRQAVRAAVAAGLPTWAECGGLMWLSRSLTDLAGKRHAMVGCLPADVRMTKALQHFGYTELRAGAGHAFLPAGLSLRGHEFHHSVLEPAARLRSGGLLQQTARPDRAELWRLPGGMATYFHAYLPSQPRAAGAFADRCRAWRPR